MATEVNTSSLSPNDTLTYTFNSDGLAAIAKADTTTLTLLTTPDVTNTYVATTYPGFEDDSPYIIVYYTEVSGLEINGTPAVVEVDGILYTEMNGQAP